MNDSKPDWVVAKVKAAIADFLIGNSARSADSLKVGCFCIAFKANIDDLLESLALNIAKALSDQLPAQVLIVEPNISELPAGLSDRALLVEASIAVSECDVLVLFLVDHDEFKEGEL